MQQWQKWTYLCQSRLRTCPTTTTKGKLPSYNQQNMHLLQEKADELEALKVHLKPEDVGVTPLYVSPCFLVTKPSGGHRMVTAFNNLGQYARILPTASTTCNEVLRKISAFKFIIKSDLTKSFYQIPVEKSSMQYLGTVTPFKGIRVYGRAVQGMPGSSEYLEELMSRVFGDYMHDGWVIIIADDINVGANTVEVLIDNWVKVLQRLQENNLSLSASKTFICPKKVLILGWVWEAELLSASPHKSAPLTSVAPPPTCSSMRSFIGAFKALAKCIPRYASLVSPLEDSIKGLQGAQRITWTTDLYEAFQHCQDALKTPRTITIPRPDDKLILTVDASPLNNGISGTLFISRNKRLLAGFFSLKLKTHQCTWKPCELDALAIAGSIKFFELYIRESTHPLQVLTDNRPCVQAFHNLCKGHFSASARISSFLSTLRLYNVVHSHLKGTANQSSDFSSRNPMECGNSMCEVCKFVEEGSSSVVKAVPVSDILSGSACMPFQNHNAWRSTQHACPDLMQAYAHKRDSSISKVSKLERLTSLPQCCICQSTRFTHRY